MKLSELKSGQGKVDITVEVKTLAPARTFNKYGKDITVANATVSDESGEMILSLWNEDIAKVKVGDKVQVSNGYVSEFQGKLQLGAGKFGKLEVVGDKPAPARVNASAPPATAPKKSKKATGEEMAF